MSRRVRLTSLPLTSALLVLLLAAGALPARAGDATGGKVYIEINPSDQRRLPIAVPDFVDTAAPPGGGAPPAGRDDQGLGALLARVISQDLEFTGLFRILDPGGFVEEPKKVALTATEIDFRDWTTVGAEALVKGRYRLEGKTLRVEARLFDPLQGTQLVGREYTGEASTARRIAHRLASDVLQALSGEPGIFDTRIAFVSSRTGTKELYVMDYDGYNVQRLTTTQSINLVPAWSPDGRQLAFVSFMERNPDLFFLTVESKLLLRLRLPFTWRGSFNGGAWAPRGLFAFGVSREGNSDLYVMNLDGSNLRPLTNHFAQDVAPSFSPDGSQVVFVSDRSGHPNLYIVSLKGETTRGESARRLTFEGKYNASPAWSPRGDRIAFACQNDRGRFDVCVIAPDGTGLTRLTGQGNNDAPSWSPDGRFIVFQSNREGPDRLYVMNANGTGQRRLVSPDGAATGDDTAPAWSPRPPE